MPKVFNKETGQYDEFGYDKPGMVAAESAAEQSGEEVIYAEDTPVEGPEQAPSPDEEEPVIPTYDAGGRVQRIMGYAHGGIIEKPENVSNLVANGEMTQEEVNKYIKPQLMKKGGKVKK